MTLNDLELQREAANVDVPRDPQPRLLDRRRVEHLLHRRRGDVRQVPVPPVPDRRRRARQPAAAKHRLRRRLLPRLAHVGSRPAHRVPADPRRRRRHDQATPSSGTARRPTAAAARPAQPAHLVDRPRAEDAQHPGREQLLLPVREASTRSTPATGSTSTSVTTRSRGRSSSAAVGATATPVEFVGNVMRFGECQGPRTGSGTSLDATSTATTCSTAAPAARRTRTRRAASSTRARICG